MTVSVKHSTSADSSFSSTGATAWNADHTLTGLGTMAEQNANNVAITGGAAALTTGTVSTTPSAATDIVNKSYADSIVKTYTAGTGLTLTTNQFSVTNTGTAGTYGSASQVPVFVTNAQGQITSVTNTTIAIAGSAVTGNISGNAANVTGTVAVGNGGTGQTTYTDGQLLIGNSTGNTLTKATLTQGTGITITNGNGAITIAASGGGSGTVTSVSGTGTVNGLTLTGTVTSSGSLTLGGTLDLSSPPAIGGTTPAAGTHTTLNLTGTTDQVSSVAVSSVPSAPSAGNLKTFARTIAGGYTAPAFLNATNTPVQLQSSFGFKKIIQGTVNGNATTYVFLPATAIGAGSFVGTATAISSANTSFYTRINKFSQVSTTTAGTFGSAVYNSNNQQVITLGVPGTPNVGGFLWVYTFGIGDTVASPRTFVGLSSATTAATNVEPSTLTNVIGVGQGAADTNLKVFYGGSAAQTPIDLGANFPTNTSSTDWYQVVLFAPPNLNNTVYYQVTRQNTGNVASGTLTGTAGTVLPANTTNLFWRGWRTNNATAAAVTLQYGAMYIETDY